MTDRILAFIATLGPIGRLPAPGTAGSLAALPLGLVCLHAFGPGWFALTTAIAFLLGLSAAGAHYRLTGKKDAGEVIIDEVVGQWLAIMAIPLPPDFSAPYLLAVAGAFVLFRLFDILKPGPVRMAEQLPGSLGVMADDVLAGVAAGIAVILAVYLWGVMT